MTKEQDRACWCRSFPGCRNEPLPGSRKHLCAICLREGHAAYTAAQVERFAARAREHR